MRQGASETLLIGARFTVKLEQHMCRAYQPVLMERVEFNPLPILENLRPTN
jgi:hypothetical protein